MAKLVKLQLSGIRSFGPYETQQVGFLTPLTLLLGQNGCGKTTIIEAIRYACTGEPPGDTFKGQGFLNDPKISGKTSTKGQVKLKLIDAKGNEITICRVAEVTQKKNNELSFSGKNQTVRVYNPQTGEEPSISGRCADTNVFVCQVMDVSSSILNNVIFCHQENSAWPLDEGQKLKQKFDEIFDADKYNKATEALRKVLKEHQSDVKSLKLELLYKKEKKDAVEKDKRRLQEKRNKFVEFEETIAKKREKIDPISVRIREICELENDLAKLQSELATKEQQRKGILEQQAALKKNIPEEFGGTDEELRQKIQSFSADSRLDQEKMKQMEERKSKIEQKLRESHDRVQTVRTRIGGLKQDKAQNERRCKERTVLMKKAISEMQIGRSTDCESENAEDVLLELKAALEACQDAFHGMIEEKEAQETDLQKAIDGIREQHASTKQIVESKQNEIKVSRTKAQNITDELTQLSTADELLESTQSKLDECKRSITNLKIQFDDVEEERKITRWNNEIRDMERKQEELESDLRILQQNDVTEGKIETENHTVMEKRKNILSLKNRHMDGLKHLFGEEVPEKGLKSAVEALQNKDEKEAKDLVDKINETQREIASLEAQHRNQKEKIESCEKDMKVKKEKIFAVCKGKNFNETIEATYKKKEDLQKDKGQYSSAKIIYETFLTEFEQDAPCCPVCLTDFRNNRGALAQIKSHIRAKIDKIPNKLSQVLDELEREEHAYNSLQQLKHVNDEVQITNEGKLPLMKDELQSIVDKLSERTKNLEDFKAKLQKPQENVKVCRAIGSDVALLDQNQLDLEKSQKTINYLKEQIVKISSDKTKREVEAEIDSLKSDVSDLKRRVEAQRKKIENHRNRMQQLLQEQSVNLSKQMSMQRKMQDKPRLMEEKEELIKKIEVLKNDITVESAKLDSLHGELLNVVEAKRKAGVENKQQIQKERNKLDSKKKIINDIEKLQNEVMNYERRKVDVELQNAEKEAKELQEGEASLNQAKDKIIELLSSKKEECAKRELEYRTLKDNVDLRAQKTLESAIDLEIVEHKKKIGGYNYRTVYQEKQRLVNESDVLEQEINSITGQKREVELSITELADELERKENKEAYKNYLSKYYELRVVEAAIQDLTKYTNALEKAILEFHKSRMVEINRSIREHWRNIYRGNDIDYIEIRAEHVPGNAKKRSYDYKVVQMKRGVQLEMRGRCSAGQKVLACLIIRMAIAETLSAHCGIFVLDEPTTNLDKANIISLSEALARIVSTRQNERNFQLLIITHDAEFLNALTRLHAVSHYFKVSRDDEGFSLITKEYNA